MLKGEGRYDVIISAPKSELDEKSLKLLRAELPAVWSDISNAMRGLKASSLYLIVLDEVLGLELSKFSRQLKLKPEINDDHKVIVDMSNDLWFRNDEINEETFTRRNVKQTVAQLEAFTLRKKPQAYKWLHLTR